jgi:four helix bundle protein
LLHHKTLVRESKHAQSDADFLSKMSIAYKEADESDFWLNHLHDNGYLNDAQFNSMNADMQRILKILTSIVKTMRIKTGQ